MPVAPQYETLIVRTYFLSFTSKGYTNIMTIYQHTKSIPCHHFLKFYNLDSYVYIEKIQNRLLSHNKYIYK